MASRTTGGKGSAIGPLTARVVGGRYEVGGLRIHEALFDLYDAHDRRLNATIGFRAALAQVITRRPLVERVEQIFRALRLFSHPNVVEINDCFREVSQMYITQELVVGPSVAEFIEARGSRRFSSDEAVALGYVLCQALASGHASGLVHGGINPDVVRFAEPIQPTDLSETIQLKAGRLFLGTKAITPKFMNYGLGPVEASVMSTRKSYGLYAAKDDEFLPPEQRTGLSPEPRSDFYSLASLVHFCITGQPPGTTATRITQQTTGREKVTAAGVPKRVVPVLMRALHRSPAERYATAEEMAEALQSLYDFLAAHPEARVADLEPEEAPEDTTGPPEETPEGPLPPGSAQPSYAPSPPPSSPPPSPPAGPSRPAARASAESNRTPTEERLEGWQRLEPRETPPAAEERRAEPSGPPHEPYPRSGVLPKVERDPRWRPPLRASSREDHTPPPPDVEEKVSPPPAPSRPPSRPATPVAKAPSTRGLPPQLPRTVTPLAILPEMALVPGGTFQMGNTENDDERPIHACTVDPFYLAVHPVTNEEYRCFVLTEGHPPPRPQSDQYAIWDGTRYPHEQARRPVVHISWDDATAYCRWLSEMTGETYRLPSEAEWERAARGGVDHKRYPWGDEEPTGRTAFDLLWTGPLVIPEVCSYPSAGFGLYDMAGLVWEWCADFYHRRYYELPEATEPNPINEAPSMLRVQRGGAWLTGARTLRCAFRGKHRPDSATVGFGFRIVREP